MLGTLQDYFDLSDERVAGSLNAFVEKGTFRAPFGPRGRPFPLPLTVGTAYALKQFPRNAIATDAAEREGEVLLQLEPPRGPPLGASPLEVRTPVATVPSSLPQFYGRLSFPDHEVLVMEWLEGATLEKVLEDCLDVMDQEIDVVDLKRIMLDVLTALAYCFQRGVVHRDVILRNVMVVKDRGAVLVDFGNACLMPTVATLDDGVVCGDDAPIYHMYRDTRRAALGADVDTPWLPKAPLDPFLGGEVRTAEDWMSADVWDAGVMFYQVSERQDPVLLPCPWSGTGAPLESPPRHGDVLTQEIIKACMSCDRRVRREILEEGGRILDLFRPPVMRVLEVCHSALEEAQSIEAWDSPGEESEDE